ncbi:MAG: 50S ribosomal protein L25 [Actinomycetes bacterium]|jgi:large subunit ribosomal protein L25|nr:MAG: 50S ribosomal protein L25 [Actinomycetota bacterium]
MSSQVTLRAQTGRKPGTRSSRRLRREGMVPAVVYGLGKDPVAIAVDARDLHAALHTDAGLNAVINLEIDGSQTVTTMAKVVERHPYRPEYRHVDFIRVDLTQPIQAEVVLHFEGEPIGVKEGGVLSPAKTHVMVEGLPAAIPGHIEVDVSGVEMGGILRVADLPAVDGVTYIDDPETVVLTVTTPAAEEPAEAAEEGTDEEAAAEEAAPADEAAEEGEGGDE